MLGRTRELAVFDFGHFRIGRYLTVTALCNDDKLLHKLREKEEGAQVRQWQNVRSEETVSRMIEQSKRPVVRGLQPIRTPFFLARRLPLNPVPTYMWQILKNMDEAALLSKHPGVRQPLSIRNYEVSLGQEFVTFASLSLIYVLCSPYPNFLCFCRATFRLHSGSRRWRMTFFVGSTTRRASY